MTPFADRRARVRYDVVGKLEGTLERSETARLVNINRTGALVETTRPIAVGTIQTIQMTFDGWPTRVNSRVRHLARIGQTPDSGPYAVGVEFLSPPDALVASIVQLAGETQSD
jgi:hypothetical protein